MLSDTSDHLNAIMSLTLTSVPSKLVCRDKETNELMDFLKDGLVRRIKNVTVYVWYAWTRENGNIFVRNRPIEGKLRL